MPVLAKPQETSSQAECEHCKGHGYVTIGAPGIKSRREKCAACNGTGVKNE